VLIAWRPSGPESRKMQRLSFPGAGGSLKFGGRLSTEVEASNTQVVQSTTGMDPIVDGGIESEG
jgi:hypothetical protein